MDKPKLSPEGVDQKVESLYLLSNEELEAQARLIHSDIRSWLLDNFDVSDEQQAFLSGLSDSYLAALSEQTARALRHRWPIIFISNTVESAVKSEKWIRSDEEDEAGSGGGRTATEHTGRLTIKTGY